MERRKNVALDGCKLGAGAAAAVVVGTVEHGNV